MFSWITNNLSTIFVIGILILIIAAIIRKMISNKKQGKSSCGCNCGSCPIGSQCHSSK